MWPAAAPCRSTSISKSEKQQKDWQKWQRCANRKEPSPGADSLRIRLEELEVSPSFKLYGLNCLNWCGWEWMGMDGNGVSGWSGYLQLRMTLWWGSSKPASVIRGTSIRIMGTGHGWQGPSSRHWRWQKNVSKAMQKRRCDFKTLMSPVLKAWLNPCFLTLNELERDAPAQRILDKCCDMLWLSTEIGSFRCFRQSQETPLLLPVQVCPRQRWCPRCIAGFSSLSQDQQVTHTVSLGFAMTGFSHRRDLLLLLWKTACSKAKSLVASWQVLGVAAENGQQLKGKDPRETLSQALTIGKKVWGT